MRSLLLSLLLGVAVVLVGCAPRSGPAGNAPNPSRIPWSAEMQPAADGSNAFAFDLYRELAREPGNVFFSPFSVHAALAMTADGANGQTRDEMVKALRLPGDREAALAAGDLGRFYAAGGDGYELAVANALWGQKGFPWRADFLDRQRTRFGAGFNEADFAADPEAERVRINRWVEEKTRERIKELLKKGIITRRTTMVLTNAIYFKGEWVDQFDPKRTRERSFTLRNGSTKNTPMMHREGGFRLYAEHGGGGDWRPKFQVAEIPYKGGDLSMVVVLPGTTGMEEMEKAISPKTLNAWVGKAHKADNADLVLPKFKIETASISLNDPLKTLGIQTAFTGADFSAMADASPGTISAVVHKAYIDVNEEGTEAAAATATAVTTSAMPSFVADHPFLFLIRDVKHGTILFMGRYETP